MTDEEKNLLDFRECIKDALDFLESERRHDLTGREERLLDYQERIIEVLDDWIADCKKRTAGKTTLSPDEEEESAAIVQILWRVCSFVRKISKEAKEVRNEK